MPHEKVREENKKRVIEEAARLFKENGLEKTTIEMIANAAGLTKRSVQNYYETKNAIILDVFRLHEKKQKDIADKYIKSEHFQSLSGLEQVRDLIGIGLRDVIIHADELCIFFVCVNTFLKKSCYPTERWRLAALCWKRISEPALGKDMRMVPFGLMHLKIPRK